MHKSYFWRDQTEISNPASDNQMVIFKALGVAPHLTSSTNAKMEAEYYKWF